MARKALLLKPLQLAAFRAAGPSGAPSRLTGPRSRSLPPTAPSTESNRSSWEPSFDEVSERAPPCSAKQMLRLPKKEPAKASKSR